MDFEDDRIGRTLGIGQQLLRTLERFELAAFDIEALDEGAATIVWTVPDRPDLDALYLRVFIEPALRCGTPNDSVMNELK